MQLNVCDVYSSPNIGIFLRANDSFILLPIGLVESKAEKIRDFLSVNVARTSIAGSRLIGILSAMNSTGMVVSRMAEDEEVSMLANATGLNVRRAPSPFTCVGNLIVANDHGAIVSPILSETCLAAIEETLSIPVKRMNVAGFYQVGSVLVATNTNAVVHPNASEDELDKIRNQLGVDVEPATINGGFPFVASGVVANSQGSIVGPLTSGPELLTLSRAFSS